jgi:hypothetical protein
MSLPSQLPQSVIQSAQQGDPQAIAAFMSSKLESLEIKVVVKVQEGCLQVLLVSEKPLNKSQCVSFVAQAVTRLQLRAKTSIRALAVYGKKTGASNLLWQHKALLTQPAPAKPEKSLTQKLSAQTLPGETKKPAITPSHLPESDEVMTIETLATAFAQWEKSQSNEQRDCSEQVSYKPQITSLRQAQDLASLI